MKTNKKKLNNNYNNQIAEFVNLDQTQALKKLEVSSFGLSDTEVEAQKNKFGNNSLKEKKFNYILSFFRSLFSPFNLILIVIDTFNFYKYATAKNDDGIRSLEPSDLVAALLVLTMIIISTTIYFVQEIRSFHVIRKMTYENKHTSKVVRNIDFKVKDIDNANSIKLIKEHEQIENSELVPGDLIYVSNGDLIPADVKVIWSNNLYLNQSSLTGEAFPVQKKITNEKESYLEYQNICYMGTEVVSGSALCLVTQTGEKTYFSAINDKVTEKRGKNSFEKGVARITLLLISFMLAVTPIVFLVFGLRPGEIDDRWFAAAMFAVSIAVGLTPEMLPIIVTANLSRGYSKIKKENVIVKNLNAVQNMGAIDILCTDKTGTITSGEINLDHVFDIKSQKNEMIEHILYLNSYFQSGFQNPIDQAVLLSKKINAPNIDEYTKEWEIPFDFKRKILSVILSKNNEKEIFTKGAIEEVLKVCNRIYINGDIVKITQEHIDKIIKKADEYNNDGFRVIGIAHNHLKDEDVEEELVFYGFGTFFDEPKKTSKKIIKELAQKGIATKVLTGDNEVITRAICGKVDFKIEKLYTGKEIEEMNEHQLHKAVLRGNVFVKLSPIHKSTIIRALKEQGHVVGFMGDGINDAPVLRESDVAISFDEASNIAKEAADIILMEESLLPISHAVHEGRVSLANILKYIKVTIASNFGNVLSVLVALFLTMAEPMQPLHLLTQNLLYDIVMFAFIFDKVDKKFTDKPRPLRTKNIIWFTVINGPVSSIFDISTFLVLLYGYHIVQPGIGSGVGKPDPAALAVFNGSWFVVGLMTQTAVMQMYRTEKIPFIQSNGSWQVSASTVLVCSLAVIVPYGFMSIPAVSEGMGMGVPPLTFLPIALSFVVAYMFLAQGVKMLYIKKFKEWL
ncbi:magnesium-translocating P-type ATPase [Spiroplasma floricola]|uniref:Magnesium-transporting ATPase, P-type 1 n=1 Tax=Spiroplasma floricola 23-6 TaxID=1336749 RepID=A0A2K8SD01_9MOLU|nr:magnesium-translocating P-type ATPase [Spiroplasma floricola]AUB31195.1 Mg(2+) transport ATPase, P-type [Spiroplasma floricola 23-6]